MPKRLYTNPSESLNNILKSRKNALGYSKKDDMPLPLFVKDVWLKVADEKMKEIEKTLTGQSENYRLIDEVKYLQVSVEKWYSMSESLREKYMNDFKSLTYEDVRKGKVIIQDELVHDGCPAYETLSVNLAETSLFHSSMIEIRALHVLNSTNAISLRLSLDEQNKTEFLVASKSKTIYIYTL